MGPVRADMLYIRQADGEPSPALELTLLNPAPPNVSVSSVPPAEA